MDPQNENLELSPQSGPKKNNSFDPNHYAVTKTVAKGLLNVALITTNANQLKTTIDEGSENNEFYGLIIPLATISMLLQTAMGIMGVFIGVKDINDEQHQGKATTLNKYLLILGVITVVINVLLAFVSC